ncbi:glycoside hydrolase family 16 protein [Zopfia rhizophila CBS 207.26]|uniref:chitinase n=1 Tax=Zopfia rhizophila CBS 207.26 TaxID=1314779 RepID=A0A6A6DMV2_9PEZI|nr:glycoside hydrolase family 16 protein [Zopfia rhizophila CBS 207.26]
MVSFTFSAIALLSALLPSTLAQTFTACNPLNTTGCPNMPALGGNATFYFNDTMNDKIWKTTNGKADWSEKGATFTINQSGDSPTVQSAFYLFFGRVEIIMKAAPGRGIVSSAILQSEDLDEVDWEFLGSNTTHVLTNYFGKGNTTSFDRGKEFQMENPMEDFHNYTVDWTRERIQWWVDEKMLRELKYEEALDGKNYPQTPMNIRLGIWSGGDVKNNDPGVVEWAGGETNFKEGPFTMIVQQVYAKDYSTAKEYAWGNMTGSWQSIKLMNGTSEALEEIRKPHGAKNRWNALPKAAQIAIIASIIGFVVIVACIIAFCCIKQRRAGRREFAALEAQQNKEASELLEYKRQMTSGRFGHGNRI